MKKLFGTTLVLVLTIALTAYGGSRDKEEIITVGASPASHAEILEKAKPLPKKKGYDLKIRPINDYTMPDKLLDKGEVGANFFQHILYLNTESEEKRYKIESVRNVKLKPMAVCSEKYKSLKDLLKSTTVYVSDNPAEQGRFLEFSVDEGLTKLKKGAKIENVKFDDITENKKDIKLNNEQLVEYLPKTCQDQDADAIIINSNCVIDQKLSLEKNSVALGPPKDSPYVNLIVVKKDHKDDKSIKVLTEVLQSKEAQDYIKDRYGRAVVSAK